MLSIPGLGRYSGSVILPPPDSGNERALPQPVDINLTLQKWRDASELGSSWGAGSATGSYQKEPEESSAGRSVIPGNPSVIPGNPSDIYRFESRSRELRLSEWPPLDKKLSLWEREVPSLERAIVRDYSGEYRHENRETSLLHRETSHRSGTSVGVSHLESAESYLREARMAGILSRDTGTSLGIGAGVGVSRLESAEAYSREARILDILSRDTGTSLGIGTGVGIPRLESADSHSREARKSRSRHGSGTTSRRKSAESHSREARRSRDSRSRRRSVARSRRKSADSRSREARRSRDSRSRRRSRSLSRRKSAESHSREPRRSRSRHGSGTRSRRKSAESHSREVRKTRAVDTDLRTEEKLRVSHQDPVTTRTADSKARSLHHESKQSTHLSSGRSASKHSSGSTSEIRYGAVGSSERVNSQPDSFGILAEGLSTQSADSSTRLALFVAFKRFGKIIDVQIHGSGESRYGLVFFRHQYSQETALEVMQGKDFFGTSLKLLPWTLPVPEKEENEPLPNQDVTVDKPGASRYLLAHGMDPRTRAEHMQKLFQEFGEILDIKIEESEGRTEYVIVEYADIASVCKAINEVDWYKGLRLSFKPSKPTVCIWMGDLPRSITEEYLMQISKLHGQVSEVILNNVKGEALVEFQSAEDAEKAIQAVRKENILEQKVVCDFASANLRLAFYRSMETTGQERRNAIAASQDKLSMGPIQELQERWRRYFEDLPLDSAEHSIEHPHLNVKRGSHQLSDASTPEEGPSSKQMSYIRKDPTDTIEGDTPNLASQGPVRVLILGHSLIDWAASRAKVHQGGLNLGLDPRSCEVIWKGFPGMTWDQLLSVLSHVISEVGQIHVLIVHLGGNDIGNTPKRKLLSNILRDLTTVQQLIPGLLVVWSSVVPRRFWYGANNPAALEIARRFLNHRVARAAPRLGFAVIDHWDFSGKDPVWFNEDGIHLSDIGLDLFNLNLSRHLQALFSHPAVYCPS